MTFHPGRVREVDLDPPPRRWRTNRPALLATLKAAGSEQAEARRILPPGWGAMTPGQRRRAVRDLMIVFGAEVCGLSERELAEVTGLARSRVHSIRERFQGHMGKGGD